MHAKPVLRQLFCVAAAAPLLAVFLRAVAYGQGDADRPAVHAALDYVAREHDRFHRHFTIFDDHASGGGHFFPSGWMGDLVDLPGPKGDAIFNERVTDRPAEGRDCLRVTYPAELARSGRERWVAVAWQSPTVDGKQLAYDLRRFVFPGEPIRLVWSLRGAGRAEFKVAADDPRADPMEITAAWKERELRIQPSFLAKPIDECFVWATNREQNPDGCTFDLDFARIEFGPQGRALRLAEPRFVRSYFAEAADRPDQHFRNVCFCYDQALAISALVATGRPEDRDRAKLIADALVYATRNDRAFPDGRVRNGYLCGDLAGQGRAGPTGTTRLPGWWDFKQKAWIEDAHSAGSDTGNAAWVILGLLNYWQAAGRPAISPHLAAAVRLGEWIDRVAFATGGPGGFTGGLEGFEPGPGNPRGQAKSPWRSTEHAIDLYAAYNRLADVTGTQRFRDCARHAEVFVTAMWNAPSGHLWTGTKDDGTTINPAPIPLDVQPWALLAFRDAKRFGPALDWAARNCRVSVGSGLAGFDFDTDRDGVWYEGTGQMALAFRLAGRHAEADACLRAIRESGVAAAPADARGAVYAASRDGLTTGFRKVWTDGGKAEPWVYYRRPHVGATCWYVLAALGYNVYWGENLPRQ